MHRSGWITRARDHAHASFCDACNNTLFFENDTLPQVAAARSAPAARFSRRWRLCAAAQAERHSIVCSRNWSEQKTRNWVRELANGAGYYLACSFDEVVPDLSDPQRLALWTETERAKRRLMYTLLTLELPLGPSADKYGVRFRLLADERVDTRTVDPPAQDAVTIGHDQGQLDDERRGSRRRAPRRDAQAA